VEVMMSGERILFVTHAEVLNTLMNGSHKLWLLLIIVVPFINYGYWNP